MSESLKVWVVIPGDDLYSAPLVPESDELYMYGVQCYSFSFFEMAEKYYKEQNVEIFRSLYKNQRLTVRDYLDALNLPHETLNQYQLWQHFFNENKNFSTGISLRRVSKFSDKVISDFLDAADISYLDLLESKMVC